jgi:hypothetical protein
VATPSVDSVSRDVDEPLQALARTRRAEGLVGLGWYAFSAVVASLATTSASAFSAIRGYEALGMWIGRFALLPLLSAVAGIAFLLRHRMRARARLDTMFPQRVPQSESLVVFGSTVAIAAIGWVLRPVMDPLNFAFGTLLFAVPLVWVGWRADSRSTRWTWPLSGLSIVTACILFWLEVAYGPLAQADDDALNTIVGTVLALTTVALVLGFSLIAVVVAGYVDSWRAWRRGDLHHIADVSGEGYFRLIEDSPRVLHALRLLGRRDEAEKRFRALLDVLPLTGPIHVFAELLADRADVARAEGDEQAAAEWQSRAQDVAELAVEAFPLNPSAMGAFARIHRHHNPRRAYDAVVAAQTRGVGAAGHAEVLKALEACILTHLGQPAAARRSLSELAQLEGDPHPVRSQEARLYRAEARRALGTFEPGELDGVSVPIYTVRAGLIREGGVRDAAS